MSTYSSNTFSIKKGGRIEDNTVSMNILPGSTVLDIGAGPGTLAVLLACAGCRVTTIEPSVTMGEAMEHYRQHMQAPKISEIRKRWENVTPKEAGLHDYVIASRSLMFGNLREKMLKMDGAAKKGVHIYWYLTSKSSSWGTRISGRACTENRITVPRMRPFSGMR